MNDRRAAFRRYQQNISLFSRDVVGVPLYPYQAGFADYALEAAAAHRNEVIVVEMPRQSGKNETSAQLEVALLARMGMRGGEIVKTAPTWKPQIVNSMRRFRARAQQAMARLPFLRYRSTQGYIFECGRSAIAFLSADPAASVVGATASLLMEVDEAQDVDLAKFDKDFSPMRASTGSPVIFYGTPWMDTSLLERAKLDVKEGRLAGRCYHIPWETVAAANPSYGAFVQSEIDRLGKDHPLIRTQYLLQPLEGGGRMLKEQQLRLMLGDHERAERRAAQAQIVAGLDFAGADEDAGELSSLATSASRDSVALTIGQVDWIQIAEGIIVPAVRVLDRYEWVGTDPAGLHTALYEILWNRWKVDRVHCDATGIGSTGTAFLAAAINKPGRERVEAVTFDSAWNTHTRLAFQYLATVNGGRLLDYKIDFNPLAVAGQQAPPATDAGRHTWWQRGHARLEARPGKKVRAFVPSDEGHDDLLVSEMLMVDAAYQVGQPRAVKTGRVDFYGQ